MRRRNAFLPRLDDALEPRVVMSHATVHAEAVVHVQAAKATRVGVLGDSDSDEYRFYAPDRSRARNWVEILSATRRVNFGPFSGARRAEPRDAGFAFNWARSGANSDDMVRTQLPGLADQVRSGKVNLSVISIGANDYLQYIQGLASGPTPSASQVADGLSRVERRAEDNLTTAVQTLLAASANERVVLVTLPDLTHLPAASPFKALPQVQPYLGVLEASIAQYNARIDEMAADHPGRVAVADLAGQFQQIEAAGSLSLAGKAIDVSNPSDDDRHLFLADGLHIGTVGQGLLANLVAQAADSAFNSGIRPLSGAEILRAARNPPRA